MLWWFVVFVFLVGLLSGCWWSPTVGTMFVPLCSIPYIIFLVSVNLGKVALKTLVWLPLGVGSVEVFG